ncbi:GNAT family N-acetyltransferase [Bacillus sp. KH172YL63]|uniref:GNAT family N-acetyltransferase n=1 Tax=Bacillus sp. KH172YL63 TaxID=2709784 RepID=UPI0013E51234|nr:GNAT family N-acetyltransferase [Bacillus sp. KH172YL63]BCB03719.1 hypothetical protein KH172YL63_18520 [Bacillus sp. KH172YL63]
MIQLIPMTEEAYSVWLKTAIKEYAEEKTTAGNFQEDTSVEQADKEFNQLLPHGLQTENHHLFTLVTNDDEKIGSLWVNTNPEKDEIFIYDIKISSDRRGKGYGKLALQSLEGFAKDRGISKFSLHVFGHNTIARALYEKSGYVVTNVLMTKTI